VNALARARGSRQERQEILSRTVRRDIDDGGAVAPDANELSRFATALVDRQVPAEEQDPWEQQSVDARDPLAFAVAGRFTVIGDDELPEPCPEAPNGVTFPSVEDG